MWKFLQGVGILTHWIFLSAHNTLHWHWVTTVNSTSFGSYSLSFLETSLDVATNVAHHLLIISAVAFYNRRGFYTMQQAKANCGSYKCKKNLISCALSSRMVVFYLYLVPLCLVFICTDKKSVCCTDEGQQSRNTPTNCLQLPPKFCVPNFLCKSLGDIMTYSLKWLTVDDVKCIEKLRAKYRSPPPSFSLSTHTHTHS